MAYRDRLSKSNVFDSQFDDFRKVLDAKGLRFKEGKIIDATFVEAPKQHNTREENATIKRGGGRLPLE